MDHLVYQNDDAMHLPGIFSLEMTVIYFCESHLRLLGVTDATSLSRSLSGNLLFLDKAH